MSNGNDDICVGCSVVLIIGLIIGGGFYLHAGSEISTYNYHEVKTFVDQNPKMATLVDEAMKAGNGKITEWQFVGLREKAEKLQHDSSIEDIKSAVKKAEHQ